MIARWDVIQKGREFLGTPYHHVGRLKGVGIDCVGLLFQIGRELGIPGVEHDLTNYSRRPDGVTLQRQLRMNADEIPVEAAISGDMLTFWIGKPHLITHAGLITPVGLLHTHARVGKVVEHELSDHWKKCIGGAFRFRGLEDHFIMPDLPPEPSVPGIRSGCCG